MMTLNKILYVTIKDFETKRRVELDDFTFDAFEFLAKQIGHKSPSTLRKMCELRDAGSKQAKLGVEDAMIIMKETGDFRLLQFITEDLRAEAERQKRQLNLFSQPIRSIRNTEE
jgi:capsule polysaccharide export protein KpsE/RkpR